MDFTLNLIWPIFHDYISVYKIWIQYTNLFKRYQTEIIFCIYRPDNEVEKKGHNSHNNWWILPLIELVLYFMIIYLCIKYESNILIFSKDIQWKPFFIYTDGIYWQTDRQTVVILYAPLPNSTPPTLPTSPLDCGEGIIMLSFVPKFKEHLNSVGIQ